MFSIPTSRLLAAGAIIALVSLGLLPSFGPKNIASINITAGEHKLSLHDTLTVTIALSAREPVNVFKGILHFDPEKLYIKAIDYNTSVADLWAELPWYSNGDGTLTFIGGTTRPGGFTGTEEIIRVTFEAQAIGETTLSMQDVRILRHDGLGTDVPVTEPVDSLFTIAPENQQPKIIMKKESTEGPALTILESKKDTDLNEDGKQTVADTSIFMVHLTTQNLRSDFNQDGVVNLKDLSILNQ